MKIVHFAEALKGGPATYLNELLPLQSKFHDITVYCPQDQSKYLNCEGIEIVTFPNTGRNIFGVAKLISNWRIFSRGRNFDIVHLHSTFAGIAGRADLAKRSHGIVYCAHGWSFGMDVPKWKKFIYGIVERILSKNTDIIVNISEAECKLARKGNLRKDKFRLVYKGISDAGWDGM